MIKISPNEREKIRSTFYKIAEELGEKYPDANANDIRETIKNIMDVSI